MTKRLFLLAVAGAFAGTLFLSGSAARAQENEMKEKHEMRMMHREMKGEQRHEDMDACCMMQDDNGHGNGFFLGMKDELGLTDEQTAQLRGLKSATQKQLIRTKADLEVTRIELHELLDADNVDMKSVDAKIEKMGELQTKMHKAQVHAMLEAQKILTPEQRQKLKQMQSKKEHRMHRHERMH